MLSTVKFREQHNSKPKTTVGELSGRQGECIWFQFAVSQVLQQKFVVGVLRDPHTEILSRQIARLSDRPKAFLVLPWIVEDNIRSPGGISIEENITSADGTVIIVVMQCQIIADTFGGLAVRSAAVNEIERHLSPIADRLGRPIEPPLRRQPAAVSGRGCEERRVGPSTIFRSEGRRSHPAS